MSGREETVAVGGGIVPRILTSIPELSFNRFFPNPIRGRTPRKWSEGWTYVR